MKTKEPAPKTHADAKAQYTCNNLDDIPGEALPGCQYSRASKNT